MSDTRPPAATRKLIDSSLQKLIESSQSLNAVSDYLNVLIESIEASIRKLNLGVSAWTQFGDSSNDDLDFVHEYLGYTRHKGVWGLAVRAVEGDLNNPDRATENIVSFAETSRANKTRAIKVLPSLLDKLNEAALRATDEITKTTLEIESLAESLRDVTSNKKDGSK